MKTLHGRCIKLWRKKLKPFCDSKISPYWRKRDLKAFCRECGVITANSMVEGMAEGNARVDFQGSGHGWSPEAGKYFDENREKYIKEAFIYLSEEATDDEINDLIDEEISEWYN